MTKQTIGSLFSIVAISALTIGCGSSSATLKSTEVSGTVIDDYISGATVCADVDNNGELNTPTDTPCVLTNSLGQFSFPATTDVTGFPLVMAGGTDVGTGEAFTGTLSAPIGSSVINPITTIIQAVVKEGNLTATAAAEIVQTSLGLPEVDLLSYDPIAALASEDADEVAAAKEVFAQQSVIQTILTTAASTIAATESDTDEEDLTDVVANQIATIMLATPTVEIDISDDTQVETIIQEAATENNTTIDATIIAAVADGVDVATDQITETIEESNTTDIVALRTEAAQIATVVQDSSDDLVEALENNTSTTDIVAAVEAATDETTFEEAIEAVEINATVLEEVATEDTQVNDTNDTIVTGLEGGN